MHAHLVFASVQLMGQALGSRFELEEDIPLTPVLCLVVAVCTLAGPAVLLANIS